MKKKSDFSNLAFNRFYRKDRNYAAFGKFNITAS